MRALAFAEVGAVSGGIIQDPSDPDYVPSEFMQWNAPQNYSWDSSGSTDIYEDSDGNFCVGNGCFTTTTYYPDGSYSGSDFPSIRVYADSSGGLNMVGDGLTYAETTGTGYFGGVSLPQDNSNTGGGIMVPTNIWSPDFVPREPGISLPRPPVRP